MYSTNRKERISIEELMPGRILAEPVLDGSGQRLLNSNVMLDASKISQLLRRGVQSVRVYPEQDGFIVR